MPRLGRAAWWSAFVFAVSLPIAVPALMIGVGLIFPDVIAWKAVNASIKPASIVSIFCVGLLLYMANAHWFVRIGSGAIIFFGMLFIRDAEITNAPCGPSLGKYVNWSKTWGQHNGDSNCE